MIDYRIWTDESNGPYVEEASGVVGTSYTATGLTQGLVYTFKVEARNIYGYSVFSNTVSILAAQVPDQPLAPATTWNPDDVIISWVAPDNAGSAITGFKLTLAAADLTYLTETANCDMTSSTAT